MMLLTHLRRKQRATARTVLALLTVVWMNMAFQPCVMALEAAAGDAHHADCPHCPKAPSGHCADQTTSRCAYIEGIDYDARVPSSPVADLYDAFVILLPALTELPVPVTAPLPERHETTAAPPADLNLHYCVFLN